MKTFAARLSCLASVAMAAALSAPAAAQSPKVGDPPEASNMRLVGMNDLQARSAYQPTIHKQGDRYIAYIGHHGGTPEVPKPLNPLTGQAEFNGTSIVDVTDPANPKYLFHIPGQEGNFEAGGAQMTRVCDGSALPKGDRNAVYLLRSFGGAGHEIWNVADPSKPVLVSKPSWNLKDTHKSYWECDTGIAYLVSGVEGWRSRRMTEVFDLSDPAQAREDPRLRPGRPAARHLGTVPTDLHGMISTGPQGNRIYFGYGTNKGGVLQIVDREKLLKGPKEPTPDNLRYPVVWRTQHDADQRRAHHRAAAADADRRVRQGQGRQEARLRHDRRRADPQRMPGAAADGVVCRRHDRESQPMVVSNFQVPEASGHFCDRGGRFGSHSSNESTSPVFYKKVAFITYFNAGVRAVDIRNPYRAEGDRLFHPVDHRSDRQALHQGGRQGPLQDRDPEQQPRDRRPRLCLCGRSRQHRHAHSRIDRRGAQGRRASRSAALA